MKSQKHKLRKLSKAKNRRKDFETKKKLIANGPKLHKTYKKPVHKQEVDRKGVVSVVQIGDKEVRYSVAIPSNIQFPVSRKVVVKSEPKKKGASKWVSKRSQKRNVKKN